ncbi:MAG: hypothetical protein KA502_01270 [Candidatus Methanomethylophilaceae archaeon]|nr:hypothetical protein [Candidatus Methanomethylophilaceae archaeon]
MNKSYSYVHDPPIRTWRCWSCQRAFQSTGARRPTECQFCGKCTIREV